MRDSSQRDFAVYEFKEDDEVIEAASGRFASRLARGANPRTEEPALSKITFLRAFSEGGSSQNEMVVKDMSGKFQMEIPSVEQICVKDDFSVSASCNMYGLGYESYDDMVEARGLLPEFIKQDLPVVEVTRSTSHDSFGEQSDCALSDERFNGMQVGNSSETGGSDASTSDHADSLESPALANCWNYSREVVDPNMQVTVLVEYVMYGSELYAESRLIFSSDCIKIDCSDETGKEFHFEWEIADIIRVNCQCSQSVGNTWIKVWLKKSVAATSMADKHAGGVVRFCVPDFQWLGKEQRIMSLAPRYKDIWSTDMELIEDEDYIMGPKPYISHRYSMDSKDCSEEVVYPKGDPDAVSISKRDLELLQPETFVNDTIIDFYIKYLTNKITPKEKDRFHFFNSFFFRKLADLDKDPSSAAEGRAAFLRVRKWTRKVNIFEKDFIFIPVNFNLHWSLLVICHPGEVACFREESMHEACRVPCILHMDSMKGSHAGLKDLFQSYLWEEWRERHQDSSLVLTFSSFRFIPVELPQQQNSFDCGLFLLHYVELFLKEAPADFNPFRITKFSDFLTIDWFVPDEASLKRFHVRNLLCDVLSNYGKDPPRSNGHFCSEPSEKNMKKESVEFLGTTINLLKTDLDISVSSSIDNEADTDCASSSFNSSRCDKGSSFLVHPFFATKATNSTDIGRHVLVQNSFSHKIRMSPIKEEEEPSGEVAPTPLEGSQSPSEVFNGRFAETSHNGSNGLDKSMQVRCDATGILSPPDATCCSSLNPLGTETAMVDEDNPLLREPVDGITNQGDETEKGGSSPGNCEVPDCPSSISGEVLAACVVEDSFEDADNSMNVDCATSAACQGTEALCQGVQMVDNNGAPTKDETVQSSDQVLVVQVRGSERHKRRKVVSE